MRLRRVGMKVAGAHFAVLSADHAAMPGDERLGLIGAHAVIREGDAVVDRLAVYQP